MVEPTTIEVNGDSAKVYLCVGEHSISGKYIGKLTDMWFVRTSWGSQSVRDLVTVRGDYRAAKGHKLKRWDMVYLFSEGHGLLGPLVSTADAILIGSDEYDFALLSNDPDEVLDTKVTRSIEAYILMTDEQQQSHQWKWIQELADKQLEKRPRRRIVIG